MGLIIFLSVPAAHGQEGHPGRVPPVIQVGTLASPTESGLAQHSHIPARKPSLILRGEVHLRHTSQVIIIKTFS